MDHARGKARATLALVLAGMAVSTSGPGIKLAFQNGVSALELAFFRAFIAAVICLVLCLAVPGARRELLSLPKKPRALLWMTLAGVAFAAHFFTWLTSLQYTSAFVAAMLGTTAPIFVLIGAALFLKEYSPWIAVAGILVATVGVVVTGFGDMSAPSGSNALLGDTLALGAAITFSAYSLFSRNARRSAGLLPFLTVLFGVAAILLFIVAAATNSFTAGKTPMAWALVFYLSTVVSLGAHGSYAYALRFYSASTVAVASLVEPIGAGVLSFFLFQEKLSVWSAIGGALILGGIGWYFAKERRPADLGDEKKTKKKLKEGKI